MSKMIGGGSDRLDLKPLSPDGNRDGNDYPELDEMTGTHTGPSAGLNVVPQPGYIYVWERRKGPDILRSRQRGGTIVERGDEDYPAGSVLADDIRPSSLDSAEIYEDLVLFRYPEEAVRRRREQEQAKTDDQLRSGAAEFVSQAKDNPAEIQFSGGAPSRFAQRKHRLGFSTGYSSESPEVDAWTPDKGIVDNG